MKEKINMSADETETCINYCKYHIGDWAELYTTDKTVMKRYEKFIAARPDLCRLIKEDKYSKTFSVHPKAVGVYPRKIKIFTEEERQQRRERFVPFATNRTT